MRAEKLYLYDINKLIGTLTGEFGGLPYEKFTADPKTLKSAVERLLIMKERWAWLPAQVRRELGPLDWNALTGTWNRSTGAFDGVDAKQVWETIAQTLPQWNGKVEEFLNRPG
ncbi:MAG TPA: hypothetical protein VGJ94_03085 [Syntrophorhabdaceae bacterium]|jgi:uncharacterized protein with HEPN domain